MTEILKLVERGRDGEPLQTMRDVAVYVAGTRILPVVAESQERQAKERRCGEAGDRRRSSLRQYALEISDAPTGRARRRGYGDVLFLQVQPGNVTSVLLASELNPNFASHSFR